MIMRWPERIKHHTVRHDFVDLNDLFPTMMDVAGLEMPKEYDYPGASVFNDNKNRNIQFVEHQHGARRWVSVRSQQYKYNYYYGSGREELFDLINDSNETMNLFEINYKNAKEISKDLRSKAVEFEKRHGLSEGIVENDFIKLDDFKPIFYRECNPPFFPANLSNDDERNALYSLEKELEEAIKNEPVVDLNLLDQEYFSKTLDINKIKEIQENRRNNK